MGSCQQSEVIEVNSQRNRDFNESSEIQENDLIEKQKKEFPDMPEWEGDRYTGIGLKYMKAYKCDLPIDELNKLRDEFWDTRNSRETPNYETWRAINQAVVYDEVRANMYLEENGLTTKNGCINHVIDQEGNHYHVPNYCINDPFFERQYKVKKNIEENNTNIDKLKKEIESYKNVNNKNHFFTKKVIKFFYNFSMNYFYKNNPKK